MSGSGGGNTTTTQTSDPWGGIQPYLTGTVGADGTGMPGAYQLYSQQATNVPSYFPGQTYAGFDPGQLRSQEEALAYANSPEMQGMLSNAQRASSFGMNSVFNPESNPVLQRYVESATRPLNQAYNEQIIPGIQDQAVGTGGLGGSRQGVAEGLASRSLMDATSDISSGIYNNAYNTGMEAQQRALAMAPQTMGLGMMPSNIFGQVGDVRQGLSQQGINENMARYDYNQNAGFDRYSQYLNTLQGTPWGGSSVTGADPNASSGLAQGMGGALAGGGLAYMMGATNPLIAGAALGGGLLGLWG